MKVIASDADAIKGLERATRREDAAEHLPSRKHDDATVWYISLDPPPDHRQKPSIAFIIGSREATVAVRVTVHLDYRQALVGGPL